MNEERNYHNDHRVIAANRNNWWNTLDEQKMTATVIIYDNDEDTEYTKTVSFKWVVCPTCNGKGSHVNSSIDCCGISGEQFAEDPDFRENYFSGTYDQPCNECEGKRVVPECADDEAMEYITKKMIEDAEYEAICAAERRMGA